MRLPRHPVALLALAALLPLAAACSSDAGSDGATDATSTTVEAGPTTTAGGDPATTTTAATSTTTAATPGTTIPDADLPGEVLELYPYPEAELLVVGVAFDDELNVRAGPGTDFDVVLSLAPTAEGLVATGRNRLLPDSAWAEVDVDGVVGWANIRFLAHEGVTAPFVPNVAADAYDTVEEMAVAVAETRATEEIEPRIVQVTPVQSEEGGPREVTVDVLGLGDDTLAGERLHLEILPVADGMFAFGNVEATALCSRGVTAERYCL